MLLCIPLNGQLFSEYDPMTVWSDDRKFAHSPRLVRDVVPNLHPISDRFGVKSGSTADVKIGEP